MQHNNLPIFRRVIRKILLITAPFWRDESFLKLYYWAYMGKCLNLRNPQTFTEKIQCLKLHHSRDALFTTMVDKYAVKKYVSNIIGDKYIIPTLGVWNTPEEIEFDKLPNKFVLKVTHDSGGISICRDKNTFDKNKAIKKLRSALNRDFYNVTREWPYKNVPRRIIAETYIEDSVVPNSEYLTDYKFYCFNGKPTYCQVIRDRGSNETIDFYDMNWKHMPFVGLKEFISNGLTPVEKPAKLDEMIMIAEKLSNGILFSRIDVYAVNQKVYFGEITFFPSSGIGRFSPSNWDKELGNLIQLHQDSNQGKE